MTRRCASTTALPLLPLLALALLLAACSAAPRRPVINHPTAVPPPPADIAAIPDAVPRDEPKVRGGANKPFYDVLGRRYYVLASAEGYVERGVASWYGPNFDGASTSIGERYDMYAMTAAHKTLPLPCYVRVTNLGNGLSVVVRVNDRGPFVANRLIDLSYTAAAKLDILRSGTALVEVRVVTAPEQPAVLAAANPGPAAAGVAPPLVPAPAPQPPQGDPLTRAQETPVATLYVQAGAFAVPENAQRLASRLRQAGLTSAFVLSPLGGGHLYRVRLGPISSVADFDQLAARLAALGVPDARLAPAD